MAVAPSEVDVEPRIEDDFPSLRVISGSKSVFGPVPPMILKGKTLKNTVRE